MKWCIAFLVFAGSALGLGQIHVNGEAYITMEDGGTDCMGSMRLVEVYVNTEDCSADSPVGLNGFQLRFRLGANTTPLYVYTRPGNSPIPFTVVASDLSVVAIMEQVNLIGWSPTLNAPQGAYHVATMCFSGGEPPLTFQVDFYPPASSLGSCVANGEGPDAINVSQEYISDAFTIDSDFGISLLPGLPGWMQDSPIYDVVEPFGIIDILDLTQIAECDH